MDDKISFSGIKLNLKFIYTAVETNKYSKVKAIIPQSNLIIIYIWSKFNWNELYKTRLKGNHGAILRNYRYKNL